MIQRGRKSAAAMTVVPITGARVLRAPDSASPEVRKAFDELVKSTPPGHLMPCDLPLILSYVEATIIATKAAKALRKRPDADITKTWSVACRLQTMLATKLRLTPHSRTHHIKLSRQLRDMTSAKPPWMTVEDEEEAS